MSDKKRRDAARLNLRMGTHDYERIEQGATREDISKKDYLLKAVDFYEEYRHYHKNGYVEPVDVSLQIDKRHDEIDMWSKKLGLTRQDFYIDAINFYLDAMILSQGQPDTISLNVFTTLLKSVMAQLDSVETKTDTLTNISINGFSSISRISSGASYLIDRRDDGELPQDRVTGKMNRGDR